jgi:hypothetical protein
MKFFKSAISLIILVTIISIASLSCQVQAEAPEIPEIDNPVINEFSLSPTTIVAAEPVTITWSTSNADTVFIHPEIGNVEFSGNLLWYPVASTTYTITATNSAGTASSSVSVNLVEQTNNSGCVFIGCDPVSGRNQSILLELEQLCLATEYQVQIAKNPEFSLLVFDSGPYAPYSTVSPVFIYPAGGVFECGHTYYVRFRVRNTATNQAIISPWSKVRCYTISPGFPVVSPHE